jgi:hypothetical protein
MEYRLSYELVFGMFLHTFNVNSYNGNSYNGNSYNGSSYNGSSSKTATEAARTTAARLMNWVIKRQLVSNGKLSNEPDPDLGP